MTPPPAPPDATHRIDAWLRLVEATNRAVDVRAVLEASVREIVDQFGCDGVVVLLPDERQTSLQVELEVGMPESPALRGRTFPLEGTVYGDVFRSGAPRTVSDVLQAVDHPIEGSVPIRSIAVVPLKSGTRCVGVLSVGSSEPGAFDGELLDHLGRFAGLVGLAVANALLQRTARTRTAQLIGLNRLAAAVAGTLSREGVLAAAMGHLEAATGFGAPAIYEIDAPARRLVRVTARGLGDAAARATATLPLYGEHTNLVRALQRRRPLLWWLREESLADAPALRVLRDEGYRSFLMIPMSAHGRLTGAITAASHRERGMDDASASIVMAVGNQVGTALQNAALYEALKTDADRLERLVEERTAALDNRNKRLRYVTSWLSHDLRRPLRSIHAIGELLLDGYVEGLPPEPRDLLSRVLRAAEDLSARLGDLLAFVHIGATDASAEPVELDRVLDECLSDLATEIEDRGARVVRSQRWPRVRMPASQARQLVTALLRNALAYGREGVAPRIEIRLREGPTPSCEVRDNGAGVEPALRAQLFHSFPWSEDDSAVSRRGTGLFVAREIVETHGGRLWYEPVEPHGSAFVFALPPA